MGYVPKELWSKLENTGKEGVFDGYSLNQSEFLIYYSDIKKFQVVRAVFEETSKQQDKITSLRTDYQTIISEYENDYILNKDKNIPNKDNNLPSIFLPLNNSKPFNSHDHNRQ